MSLPLKTSDAPAHQAYALTAKELRLRRYFIDAFNDAGKPDWAMKLAVCDVTDELKEAGETVEAVIKRVKYVAAISISFHYRFGYAQAHSRLKEAASKAASLSIGRYFGEPCDRREDH